MGLREEWERIQAVAVRAAADVTHLTTLTDHDAGGAIVASVQSDVELDGDTTTRARGDVRGLIRCHDHAVAFTSELAAARVRMIAQVFGAFV